MKSKLKFICLALVILISYRYSQCEKCTSFEEAFKAPEKVTQITYARALNEIQLDSLPNRASKFKSLKIMYLSSNNIKSISSEIKHLQNLEELSFAENQLENIPEELFELKNLKEVILSSNKFSEATIKTIREKFKAKPPNTLLVLSEKKAMANFKKQMLESSRKKKKRKE